MGVADCLHRGGAIRERHNVGGQEGGAGAQSAALVRPAGMKMRKTRTSHMIIVHDLDELQWDLVV